MRAITRLGVLLLLATAAAAPSVRAFRGQQITPTPATGTLSGIVARLGTNEALAKATVELRGPQNTETTTELDGKFVFPDLTPGSYRLRIRRDGYWPAEHGQRWVDGPGQPLTIVSGQRLTDVKVLMTPTAAITGRIASRSGQPLAGARIRAMKPTVRENQRALRVIQEAIANDLGEYRLSGLIPGRYYVSATVTENSAAGAAAAAGAMTLVQNPDAPGSTDTTSTSRSTPRQVTVRPTGNGLAADEIFAPIFFPATADGRDAISIDVDPGGEYRGADIFVYPIRTFHVRGRVSNLVGLPGGTPGQQQEPPNGAPPQGAGQRGGRGNGQNGGQGNVRLAPLDPNGPSYTTAVDATTGAFDFQKVQPGAYAAYMYVSGLTVRGPFSVEVIGGDIDNLVLDVTPGVDIPVRLAFDGEPPSGLPNISTLNVTLWRDPTLMSAPSIPVTGGEMPAIKNLSMGDYRVYVNPLLPPLNGIEAPTRTNWPNAYVKSIRFADDDVLNGGLHVRERSDAVSILRANAANPTAALSTLPLTAPSTNSKGNPVLEIVIGANPGTIEGQVMNGNGEPVPSITVTLFADVPENRILRTDMYRVTSSDETGKFLVQGLPPGDYKVFAWENIERGAWIDSIYTLPFEGFGKTIHVNEGGKERTELTVIRPK